MGKSPEFGFIEGSFPSVQCNIRADGDPKVKIVKID
jgi:hypothetical protein